MTVPDFFSNKRRTPRPWHLRLAAVAFSLLALSSPAAALFQAANVPTSGDAHAIAIEGDLAFVSVRNIGISNDVELLILDISNPLAPVILGTYPAGGPVAVSGNIAIVGSSVLEILDVSNPAAPVQLSTYNPGTDVRDLFIEGPTVHIAAGIDGLQRFDISNPSAPFARLGNNSAGFAQKVWVDDGTAYLAARDGGLQSFDVSNRFATPVPMSTILDSATGGDGAFTLEIVGNVAYVRDYSGPEIKAVDISNPASMSELAGVALDSAGNGNAFARGRGGLLFYWAATFTGVTTPENGFRVIDVANPAVPVDLTPSGSTIGGPTFEALVGPGDARFSGAYLIVAAGNQGVSIIDTSLPNKPEFIGHISTAAGLEIEGAGDLLVLTQGSGNGPFSVRTWDISDPALPFQRDTRSYAENVPILLDGSTLYVLRSAGDLEIIDVSNPSSMALIHSYHYASSRGMGGGGLYLDFPLLYVSQTGGFKILDVSTPTAPTEIGSYSTGVDARRIDVVGDIAYYVSSEPFGAGSGRLVSVDVSIPVVPVLLGQTDRFGVLSDVKVINGHAYVSSLGAMSPRVFDVSSPGSPSLLSTPRLSRSGAMDVAGGLLYLSGDNAVAVDVSNPSEPFVKGFVGSPRGALDIAVVGEYAYTAVPADLIGGPDNGFNIHHFGPEFVSAAPEPPLVPGVGWSAAILMLVAAGGLGARMVRVREDSASVSSA